MYGNTEDGKRAFCRSKNSFPRSFAGMQENILHIVIFLSRKMERYRAFLLRLR
jgi:hypothetical protein